MTAPDRIWAWHHKDAMLDNRQWADNPYARYHLPATEYVRSDLARAPLAEALAVPEVAAVVYAAKMVMHDLHHGNGLEGLYENRDRLDAALRAIGGDV